MKDDPRAFHEARHAAARRQLAERYVGGHVSNVTTHSGKHMTATVVVNHGFVYTSVFLDEEGKVK